ncbi:hypothetical protein BN946_scf185007.g80 [Trametes cinnabarina]|uniref:Transposase domain-containing protein n=1 Tax=Pycnoporus cinnabarinus TaxID=5643 RepID=A0A060SFN0_PYCCI|nr:hypothetical protein BN946_scf185007.g80 [Trametes cinnabarina]
MQTSARVSESFAGQTTGSVNHTNSQRPSTIPLKEDALGHMNDADPFAVKSISDNGHPHTSSIFTLAHPVIVLFMLLVAWLHVAAHLPFRFCDVILTVFGYTLVELGHSSLVPSLRTTLTSCLALLRLEPRIRLYPTCPKCLAVHPEDVAKDSECARCGHPLFKVEPTPRSRSNRRGDAKRYKPYLQTPAKTLSEQLAALLLQPGFEEALGAWRRRSRSGGWLTDFFDGAISRELLGPDKKPFFRHDLDRDPDDEIRIGVALGLDWFSYLRSLISPSYSSCPISLNIVNLPPSLRYRAGNLLLSMIIPGPKESNPDQTQGFLKILVSELIRLWRDGIVLPTHAHPEGRRIRVILVGVFCDKPAAHKVAGFGSHKHTFFCTRCWISQGKKALREAFMPHGFQERTDRHHRLLMQQYREAQTDKDREEHASAFATRWSELARLPYFDFQRMVVVDPMHNLFLGLVKTHFYHIWVQLKILRRSCELRRVHEILAQIDLPSRLGRLPRLIGEPAGGSLTADQWLILATVVGPLAFPELWTGVEPCRSPTDQEADQATTSDEAFFHERHEVLRTRVAQRKKSSSKSKKATDIDVSNARVSGPGSSASEATRRSVRARKPTEKAKNMVLEMDDAGAHLDDESDHEWDGDEDDINDEDAAGSADSISEAQLAQAEQLIREYCIELVELYGADVIRPNHHYATHTAEFIRDYGPMRGFWTFIFERLNKILKSYRTNNHEGGEIECTFMREFYRTSGLICTLTEGLQQTDYTLYHLACQRMQEASKDGRGTLQQLAQEVEDEYADGI